MQYEQTIGRSSSLGVRIGAATGAVSLLLLLTGCAGTKLVAQWKDYAYTGRPVKVFVLGVSEQRGPRSLVEDEFVRQFKEHGTDAVASYKHFPEGPQPTKDDILAKTRVIQRLRDFMVDLYK